MLCFGPAATACSGLSSSSPWLNVRSAHAQALQTVSETGSTQLCAIEPVLLHATVIWSRLATVPCSLTSCSVSTVLCY